MNRHLRAMLGTAVGGGLIAVAALAGFGLHAWLRPDLTRVSNAELKSESWVLIEQTQSNPWFIGWASAVRHEHVHEEMRRRGLFSIGMRSDSICVASDGAFDSQDSEQRPEYKRYESSDRDLSASATANPETATPGPGGRSKP